MKTLAIVGEDAVLRRDTLREILGRYVAPEDRVFDVHYLDGRAATCYDITCELQGYALGAGPLVVVVSDADRLGAETRSALASELASMPETSTLVLVCPNARTDGGLGSAMTKAVCADGQVLKLGGSTKADRLVVAANYAQSFLARAGVGCSPQLANHIAQRAGTDCQVLRHELTKLLDYTYGRGIGAADVEKIVTQLPEERIFQLVEALLAADVRTGVALVAQCIGTSEEPSVAAHRILKTIRNRLVQICQTKVLSQRGCDISREARIPESLLPVVEGDPSLADTLKRHAWQAKGFAAVARRTSWERLEAMMDVVETTRELLETNDYVADPTLALSVAAIRMAGAGQGR